MAWLSVSRTRITEMCEAAQVTGITIFTTTYYHLDVLLYACCFSRSGITYGDTHQY